MIVVDMTCVRCWVRPVFRATIEVPPKDFEGCRGRQQPGLSRPDGKFRIVHGKVRYAVQRGGDAIRVGPINKHNNYYCSETLTSIFLL
jgi:hypothetical protein